MSSFRERKLKKKKGLFQYTHINLNPVDIWAHMLLSKKAEVLDIFHVIKVLTEVRGGAVAWGTVLQSVRWRFRFPMV